MANIGASAAFTAEIVEDETNTHIEKAQEEHKETTTDKGDEKSLASNDEGGGGKDKAKLSYEDKEEVPRTQRAVWNMVAIFTDKPPEGSAVGTLAQRKLLEAWGDRSEVITKRPEEKIIFTKSGERMELTHTGIYKVITAGMTGWEKEGMAVILKDFWLLGSDLVQGLSVIPCSKVPDIHVRVANYLNWAVQKYLGQGFTLSSLKHGDEKFKMYYDNTSTWARDNGKEFEGCSISLNIECEEVMEIVKWFEENRKAFKGIAIMNPFEVKEGKLSIRGTNIDEGMYMQEVKSMSRTKFYWIYSKLKVEDFDIGGITSGAGYDLTMLQFSNPASGENLVTQVVASTKDLRGTGLLKIKIVTTLAGEHHVRETLNRLVLGEKDVEYNMGLEHNVVVRYFSDVDEARMFSASKRDTTEKGDTSELKQQILGLTTAVQANQAVAAAAEKRAEKTDAALKKLIEEQEKQVKVQAEWQQRSSEQVGALASNINQLVQHSLLMAEEMKNRKTISMTEGLQRVLEITDRWRAIERNWCTEIGVPLEEVGRIWQRMCSLTLGMLSQSWHGSSPADYAVDLALVMKSTALFQGRRELVGGDGFVGWRGQAYGEAADGGLSGSTLFRITCERTGGGLVGLKWVYDMPPIRPPPEPPPEEVPPEPPPNMRMGGTAADAVQRDIAALRTCFDWGRPLSGRLGSQLVTFTWYVWKDSDWDRAPWCSHVHWWSLETTPATGCRGRRLGGKWWILLYICTGELELACFDVTMSAQDDDLSGWKRGGLISVVLLDSTHPYPIRDLETGCLHVIGAMVHALWTYCVFRKKMDGNRMEMRCDRLPRGGNGFLQERSAVRKASLSAFLTFSLTVTRFFEMRDDALTGLRIFLSISIQMVALVGGITCENSHSTNVSELNWQGSNHIESLNSQSLIATLDTLILQLLESSIDNEIQFSISASLAVVRRGSNSGTRKHAVRSGEGWWRIESGEKTEESRGNAIRDGEGQRSEAATKVRAGSYGDRVGRKWEGILHVEAMAEGRACRDLRKSKDTLVVKNREAEDPQWCRQIEKMVGIPPYAGQLVPGQQQSTRVTGSDPGTRGMPRTLEGLGCGGSKSGGGAGRDGQGAASNAGRDGARHAAIGRYDSWEMLAMPGHDDPRRVRIHEGVLHSFPMFSVWLDTCMQMRRNSGGGGGPAAGISSSYGGWAPEVPQEGRVTGSEQAAGRRHGADADGTAEIVRRDYDRVSGHGEGNGGAIWEIFSGEGSACSTHCSCNIRSGRSGGSEKGQDTGLSARGSRTAPATHHAPRAGAGAGHAHRWQELQVLDGGIGRGQSEGARCVSSGACHDAEHPNVRGLSDSRGRGVGSLSGGGEKRAGTGDAFRFGECCAILRVGEFRHLTRGGGDRACSPWRGGGCVGSGTAGAGGESHAVRSRAGGSGERGGGSCCSVGHAWGTYIPLLVRSEHGGEAEDVTARSAATGSSFQRPMRAVLEGWEVESGEAATRGAGARARGGSRVPETLRDDPARCDHCGDGCRSPRLPKMLESSAAHLHLTERLGVGLAGDLPQERSGGMGAAQASVDPRGCQEEIRVGDPGAGMKNGIGAVDAATTTSCIFTDTVARRDITASFTFTCYLTTEHAYHAHVDRNWLSACGILRAGGCGLQTVRQESLESAGRIRSRLRMRGGGPQVREKQRMAGRQFKEWVGRRWQVKGDGSCFIYAVMAALNILEHGSSTVSGSPSLRDLAVARYLRERIADWYTDASYEQWRRRNTRRRIVGAPAAAGAEPPTVVVPWHQVSTDIAIGPEYDAEGRCKAMGTYGGQDDFLALACILSVNIVAFDANYSYGLRPLVLGHTGDSRLIDVNDIRDRILSGEDGVPYAVVEWNGVAGPGGHYWGFKPFNCVWRPSCALLHLLGDNNRVGRVPDGSTAIQPGAGSSRRNRGGGKGGGGKALVGGGMGGAALDRGAHDFSVSGSKEEVGRERRRKGRAEKAAGKRVVAHGKSVHEGTSGADGGKAGKIASKEEEGVGEWKGPQSAESSLEESRSRVTERMDNRKSDLVASNGSGSSVGERVLFWNTRILDTGGIGGRKTGGESDALAAKLEWIDEYIDSSSPLMIALCEVMSSGGHWKLLRSWFRRRKYLMVFLPGEGRGREESEEGSGANGIAVALRQDARVAEYHRVAERALAVVVVTRQSTSRINIVVMHGLHRRGASEEGSEDNRSCEEPRTFGFQFGQAVEWIRARGGGLLMGDFNRVVCKSWRTGEMTMTKEDRALRRVVGWECDCCAGGGIEEEWAMAGTGRLVGRQTDDDGDPVWTRIGRGGDEKARLDFGIEFGEGPFRWLGGDPVEATHIGGTRKDVISDHMGVEFRVFQRAEERRTGEMRPMPLKCCGGRKAGNNGKARQGFIMKLGNGKEIEEVSIEAVGAFSRNESEVQVWTSWMRKKGEEAEEEVRKEQGRKELQRSLAGWGCKQKYRSWRARLQEALRAQAAGEDPRHEGSPLLFHPATGLSKHLENETAEQIYQRVIRVCRRHMRRASARIDRKRVIRTDRRLVDEAKVLSRNHHIDPGARASRIFRMISERRRSIAIDTIYPNDDKSNLPVKSGDERFLREVGKIGEGFVNRLDVGAVPDCYEAWFRNFKIKFDELPSIHGGEWRLDREISFPMFEDVLRTMGGKAVGAGGISVEILRLAPGEVRYAFYKALLSDVNRNCLSENWGCVLYALLIKPPPNDPDIIGERREIALMPQDLKIFLQLIRRAVYARMAERVAADQWGWREGVGAADAALALQLLIQQAKRLGHSIWILYIDIAQFFPSINREVATIGELMLGVPERVREIALIIYGKHSGDAISCQYETGGGLGDPFRNWMGWLMGCPLSPDKSKLLLNSVVIAIRALARGVTLWGAGNRRRDVDETWREVVEVTYADDWCGAFTCIQQLHLAWDLWCEWEAMVGGKIGVKGKLKTVLTGVTWSKGKAVTPRDPKLALSEGSGQVPFMRCDEAYKHMGGLRCANGCEKLAWEGSENLKGIRQKLMVAVRRLGRIRRGSVSREEFVMISDVILGGLATYYLQCTYASFEELDSVEASWRGVFNRLFQRCRSTPRVELYVRSARSSRARTHLYAFGIAAAYTAMEKAMSDPGLSSVGHAARSAVALALWSWGCREDPNRWSWRHLKKDLERSLQDHNNRIMSDVWMLACLEMEGVVDREESREEELAIVRRTRLGRWEFPEWLEVGWGPLCRSSTHFAAPRSVLLFSPQNRGGLELDVERELLWQGVVAVGHMCRRGIASGEPEFIRNAMAATAHHQGLRICDTGGWERLIEAMEDMGVEPVEPEHIRYAKDYWDREGSKEVERESSAPHSSGVSEGPAAGHEEEERERARGEKRRRSKSNEEEEKGGSTAPHSSGVSEDSAAGYEEEGISEEDRRRADRRQLISDIRGSRGGGRQGEGAVEEWRERLRAANGEPKEKTGLSTPGISDRLAQARGARIGHMLSKERNLSCIGGESGFCRREDVGEDGFFTGWWEREVRLLEMSRVEVDGHVGFDVEHIEELPSALELVCRARSMVGEDVPVLERGLGAKSSRTHIALDAQERDRREVCRLEARFRFSAAYTLDASWDKVVNDEGKVVFSEGGHAHTVVGVAAIRHDGEVLQASWDDQGGSNIVVGCDNYLGEMGALLMALRDAGIGQRVLLILDASSPVSALLRFRKKHDRVKSGYYADVWLSALDELVSKQEVVVFCWVPSHTGSAMNEAADVAATRARRENIDVGEDLLEIVESTGHFIMRPTLPARSYYSWAVCHARQAVANRLIRYVANTVLFEAGDLVTGSFGGRVDGMLSAVGARRMLLGDEGRRLAGNRKALVERFGCVHGCGCVATWAHVCFECPGYLEERRLWESVFRGCRSVISAGEHHAQLDRLGKWLNGRGGAQGEERSVRRAVAGMIAGCNYQNSRAEKEAIAAARELIRQGAELLERASEAEKDLAEDIRKALGEHEGARTAFEGWKRLWVERGAGRAAALTAVRVASTKMLAMGRWMVGRRLIGKEEESRRRRLLRKEKLRQLEEVECEWGQAQRDSVRTWRGAMVFRWWKYSWVKDGGRGMRGEVALQDMWMAVVARHESTDIGPRMSLPEMVLRVQSGWSHVSGRACNDAEGWWWIKGVKDEYRAACRMWWRCGGSAAFDRRNRERVRERKEAEVAASAAGMKEYLREGGEGSCSGMVLEPVGEKIELEREAKVRRRASNRVVRFERGDECNNKGQWCVERVIQVRRRGDGSGRYLTEVEWRGGHGRGWVKHGQTVGVARIESNRLIALAEKARRGAIAQVRRTLERQHSGRERWVGKARRSPRLMEVVEDRKWKRIRDEETEEDGEVGEPEEAEETMASHQCYGRAHWYDCPTCGENAVTDCRVCGEVFCRVCDPVGCGDNVEEVQGRRRERDEEWEDTEGSSSLNGEMRADPIQGFEEVAEEGKIGLTVGTSEELPTGFKEVERNGKEKSRHDDKRGGMGTWPKEVGQEEDASQVGEGCSSSRADLDGGSWAISTVETVRLEVESGHGHSQDAERVESLMEVEAGVEQTSVVDNGKGEKRGVPEEWVERPRGRVKGGPRCAGCGSVRELGATIRCHVCELWELRQGWERGAEQRESHW